MGKSTSSPSAAQPAIAAFTGIRGSKSGIRKTCCYIEVCNAHIWSSDRSRQAGTVANENDRLLAIQRGGIQTPTIGWFESWRLWWKHRVLMSRLSQGDVPLNSIQ